MADAARPREEFAAPGARGRVGNALERWPVMMFKLLLALAATLASLQGPGPIGGETGSGGGSGWQSARGGSLCTTTRLPNGRMSSRCEKR